MSLKYIFRPITKITMYNKQGNHMLKDQKHKEQDIS